MTQEMKRKQKEWISVGVMTPAKFAYIYCNETCLLSGAAEEPIRWGIMSKGNEIIIEASALEMIGRLIEMANSGEEHYIMAGKYQVIKM